MSESINLLGKSTRRSVKERPMVAMLRVCAIVLLFFIPALSVVLYFFIALSPLPAVKAQEQQSIQNLAIYQPEMVQLLLTEQRSSAITRILLTRTKYDAVLTEIEHELPATLSVTQYSLNGSTVSVTISGTSFNDVNTFFTRLTQDPQAKLLFSHVVLDNLTLDSTSNDIVATTHMTIL